jgi:hypothetical protein
VKRILALAAIGIALGNPAWAEPALVVSVSPGSAYSHKVKLGLMTLTMTPQMAVWIERSDGGFVDTIYVTRKSATAAWSAAGGARRPEALPAWSYARGIAAADGLYMPDKKHGLPDAVSGATPAAAFSKSWKIPASLAPGRYRVKAELNSSFDWNEAYPDRLPKADPRWSEVNGQPSIVWEGDIELGGATRKGGAASLAPVGTGSLRGEGGAVTPGLAGIASARMLAASIVVEYRP